MPCNADLIEFVEFFEILILSIWIIRNLRIEKRLKVNTFLYKYATQSSHPYIKEAAPLWQEIICSAPCSRKNSATISSTRAHLTQSKPITMLMTVSIDLMLTPRKYLLGYNWEGRIHRPILWRKSGQNWLKKDVPVSEGSFFCKAFPG